MERDWARLERWLDESEEHRQYYSQMKELWDSSEVVNPHFLFDDEKAYILFSKRCASFAGIPRKRLSVPWWKRGVAVAAVLIPFVFLSYFTVSGIGTHIKFCPQDFHFKTACLNNKRYLLVSCNFQISFTG